MMHHGESVLGRIADQRRSTRRAARNRSAMLAAAAVSMILGGRAAHGAISTWTGAAGDSLWVTPGNWNGAVPGSTDGAAGASPDIAVFNTPGGTGFETVPDANRNILGITFDIQTAGSGKAIGIGGTTTPLYLTGGGTIQVNDGTFASSSNSINSPMVIVGNSYTFVNNAVSNTAEGLKPNGNITGGVAGNTTITFDGTNFGGVLTSNNQVVGAITDGAATHLNVVKNGTGVWDFRAPAGSGANTYTGQTVVNAGGLRLNGAGAMSAASDYSVFNTGTIRFSVAGMTGRSLTVNTGGIASASNDGVITNFASNSGPALTVNEAGATAAVSIGAPLNLTGTVEGEGGVKLVNDDSTPKVSWTKNIDLGSVNRTFDIAHSATNETAGDPDLQVNGVISGSAGVIKTGAGVLKLNNVANTFTGPLDIRGGAVRFNGADAMTAHPAVIVNGGELDISTFNQTVGAVTVNRGTISTSSTTPAAMFSPSYNFSIAAADTAKASAILSDSGGPSAVTKTGAGRAQLTGANNYTGVTTVSGGTLTLGTAAWNPVLTGPGGANITQGRLVFDYTGGSSPQATVTPILKASHDNAGFNNANQIRSTTADGSKGLGWVDDGTSKLTVGYVYYGDSDLSGTVDLTDFTFLAANFNGSGKNWLQGDYNYDGTVDLTDFTFLASNFNKNLPTGADAAAGLGAAVPEPASVLAMLALGGASVLRRRRRR